MKKSPEEIRTLLAHCCGTEGYHKLSIFGNTACTDGIKCMAESCGAFWLVDAIISHQSHHRAKKEEFQVWNFKFVEDTNAAILECIGDNERVIVRQDIKYSEFPLREGITIYHTLGSLDGVTPRWVMMLPSEN